MLGGALSTYGEVTPEIAPRTFPIPPQLYGEVACSPPHTPIAIPSPERRHRRTFENVEMESRPQLSLPTFRKDKMKGACSSLGRHTCENCGIVFGGFGGSTSQDDFCSADCRTNFILQRPEQPTFYQLPKAEPIQVVEGAPYGVPIAKNVHLVAGAVAKGLEIPAYKRIMPVTVSRDASRERFNDLEKKAKAVSEYSMRESEGRE